MQNKKNRRDYTKPETVDVEKTKSEAVAPEKDIPPKSYKVVNCDKLRVRKAGDAGAAVLGIINSSSIVKGHEANNGWLKIDYLDGVGYVMTDFVERV